MDLVQNDERITKVTVSERNLRDLLENLEEHRLSRHPSGMIRRQLDDGRLLLVAVEEDETHYADRPVTL